MRLSVTFFSLLLIVFCQNSFAYKDLKSYPQNYWEINAGYRFFQATANYSSSGGSFSSLPSGYGYKLHNVDIGTRSTVPDLNMAYFTEFQIAAGESTTPYSTRTNSALTSALIGTDFIMHQGTFSLIPEFTFLYPFKRNDVNSDAVAINEGAMEIAGRLIAQTQWAKSRLGAYVGFTYRDENRASLIPYGLTADYALGKWKLGADLKGYTYSNYDKDTNNELARNAWTISSNGGSLKHYSINPALLETHLWAQVQVSKDFVMDFGGGTTLNGSNNAAGWNAFLGLTYRVPSIIVPEKIPEVDRFKEEVSDGVNQELFQPEPPPPTIRKKQKNNIQDELDKTEMQIELKTDKKRKRQR
ncbi:MAG: hypothetical protein BroJett040_03970 [Oligoflexia bacterium]|nr:MAG: hypothetical protein BroJett040_03970 [Oligoflexia bacterium]